MTDLRITSQREAVGGSTQPKFESRVVIEDVRPQIDGGKFPIKRAIGDNVAVIAHIHADGHNIIAAELLWRHIDDRAWSRTPLALREAGLDRYEGRFTCDKLGSYEYTIEAWINEFANWKRDLSKLLQAGRDVSVELTEGAEFFRASADLAPAGHSDRLREYSGILRKGDKSQVMQLLEDTSLDQVMFQYAPRGRVRAFERALEVTVEPEYATFSSWYEMFPRSCSDEPGRHGTFHDVIRTLPYVADMGFDVLYLPPIHPIGKTKRKGPNNTLQAGPQDPGSPWAIGSEEGGHKSIHPQLGTFEDLAKLVQACDSYDIKLALDIAFQCSPDHPYVKEHPEWFYHRPDGSIKCAENPPKKYEDIFPLNFESDAWQSLWDELVDVILFWVDKGVSIFRVDNPHTKPYEFWQYLIGRVKRDHPEVIFLSEAFARPMVMRHLAKCGFSQSYTYFTWRNTKFELESYVNELTRTELAEYLRPNFFANTPDILPEYLQVGGRAAFMIRAALAATLSPVYGIYGPAFELCVGDSLHGGEEYRDSEKYEVKHWNLDDPISISGYLKRLNTIRNKNRALQSNKGLRFVEIDNKDLIAYLKTDSSDSELLLTIVNLDPHNAQSGYVKLPLDELGIEDTFQVHDLMTDRRFIWNGQANLIRIEPGSPAAICKIRKKLKREHNFDYFL